MFGAHALAYSAYHAAKRDFNGDGAWLFYAGALEMAALSLYMQPTDPTRKAHEYADESIVTYLNSCRYYSKVFHSILDEQFNAVSFKLWAAALWCAAKSFQGRHRKQLCFYVTIKLNANSCDLIICKIVLVEKDTE